jgi:hypothetical protein
VRIKVAKDLSRSSNRWHAFDLARMPSFTRKRDFRFSNTFKPAHCTVQFTFVKPYEPPKGNVTLTVVVQTFDDVQLPRLWEHSESGSLRALPMPC